LQFLKTLFWAFLVVVITVFSIGNWTTVQVRLWGGLVADVNLPLLLLLTFLAGLMPVLLYHHAVKWRLNSRLATAERTITDLRDAATAAVNRMAGDKAPADTPKETIPPAAIPGAVPPGGA